MIDLIEYISTHADHLIMLSVEQLTMALLAVLLGVAVAVPLGIWISKSVKWVKPVLWVVNALQTIPVLALAGFLMIVFGLGKTTAVFGLFVYTLLPIVQSTYKGLVSIDPKLIETASGMGMSDSQIFWRIELPLALQVIFVGIRISAVVAISTATLMSLVGAGGLGYEIFTGINRLNNSMIIAGSLLAALLAFVVDRLLQLLQGRMSSPGLQNR
ncbi:ABC transporter permease [Paenibacillus solisilvae]|uniref:ABC transporter permease n=1 Tax=Paenibacillus solisilvae TaxID=2486751 RepID=A0ABW0VYJ9_9BACL